MLVALICGTTDPEILADLVKGMREDPGVAHALEGRFEPMHRC